LADCSNEFVLIYNYENKLNDDVRAIVYDVHTKQEVGNTGSLNWNTEENCRIIGKSAYFMAPGSRFSSKSFDIYKIYSDRVVPDPFIESSEIFYFIPFENTARGILALRPKESAESFKYIIYDFNERRIVTFLNPAENGLEPCGPYVATKVYSVLPLENGLSFNYNSNDTKEQKEEKLGILIENLNKKNYLSVYNSFFKNGAPSWDEWNAMHQEMNDFKILVEEGLKFAGDEVIKSNLTYKNLSVELQKDKAAIPTYKKNIDAHYTNGMAKVKEEVARSCSEFTSKQVDAIKRANASFSERCRNEFDYNMQGQNLVLAADDVIEEMTYLKNIINSSSCKGTIDVTKLNTIIDQKISDFKMFKIDYTKEKKRPGILEILTKGFEIAVDNY
jgi:hypothetical protein